MVASSASACISGIPRPRRFAGRSPVGVRQLPWSTTVTTRVSLSSAYVAVRPTVPGIGRVDVGVLGGVRQRLVDGKQEIVVAVVAEREV